MKAPKNNRTSLWILAAGVVLGGVTTAAIKAPLGVSHAIASGTQGTTVAGISAESMRELNNLNSAFVSLAKAVEPAVVNITSKRSGQPGNPFNPGEEGTGSGVIFRPDGYIVTNDHVVDGFDDVSVQLFDGRSLKAKVVGTYSKGDIAVIKIDATDLATLPFADSNTVNPGQVAMAVGSPFGLSNTVTIGHISALSRQQQIGDPMSAEGQRFYPDLIQTDAAINPGNSGGALVNVNGEVVGINTAIASSSGASNGIGFAIPSNEVQLIAEKLIKDGKVTQAFLGVIPEPLTPYQQKQLNIDSGAYLAMVPSNSPAATAGLQKGDVVTQIGSTPITTYMDLRNAMLQYAPGTSVKIGYWRNGKSESTNAKLETPPVVPTQSQNQKSGMNPFGDGQNPFGQGQIPFRNFRINPRDFQSPRNNQNSGPLKLGVGVAPISNDLRSQFSIPQSAAGVVVETVEPGSVADSAGLQTGDVITEVNGVTIRSPQDVVNAMKKAKAGANGSISYRRFSSGGTSTFQQEFTY